MYVYIYMYIYIYVHIYTYVYKMMQDDASHLGCSPCHAPHFQVVNR